MEQGMEKRQFHTKVLLQAYHTKHTRLRDRDPAKSEEELTHALLYTVNPNDPQPFIFVNFRQLLSLKYVKTWYTVGAQSDNEYWQTDDKLPAKNPRLGSADTF